ncbi:hypothetical protein FQZ97_627970 [compost metagenome]
MRVAQGQHGLRQVALRFLVVRQRGQAGAFAAQVEHFEQHVVEDAHQHRAGALALGLGHVGFHEFGDRLPAALRRGVGLGALGAREQRQRTGGRHAQLLGHFGALGVGRLGDVALDGALARGGVAQRGAHAHEAVHRALLVGRHAQVAERLLGLLSHAQQEHRLAVAGVDRHHVVLVLARLASRVAQLVADAGADVAQHLGLVGLVGGAQARLDAVAQVDLAHVGAAAHRAAVGEVLHVDHAQRGVLERELVLAVGDLGARAADDALDLEGLGRGRHRHRLELHRGAAVVEARLVDLHALVAGRVVHLDARGHLLAALAVVQHHLAGEQLGHAGRVVVDDELLQLDGERQLLQQHAVGLVQDGHVAPPTLGHEDVAAEGRVGGRQAVLGRHVGDHAAAREHALAVEPGLGAHHEVAVEQAADAHQHDGAVGGDVAQLVGTAGARRDHPARCGLAVGAGVALLQLDLPAAAHEQLADAVGRHVGRFRQAVLGALAEGLQALGADVFLEGAQVDQDARRVARDAQRRADHQEQQDQQEPPGAVDRVEPRRAEQLGPEGPELVDVVVDRLMLLEHGADDRGDADDREQRDREAHRRQQFHRGAKQLRAAMHAKAMGGNGHRRETRKEEKNKRAGHPPGSARPLFGIFIGG